MIMVRAARQFDIASRVGRRFAYALLVTLCAGAFASSGCRATTGKGAIKAESLNRDPVVLRGAFGNVFYTVNRTGEAACFLSDVSPDRFLSGDVTNAQLIHVELLWLPKPGATPLDRSATNASVRYVIVAEGEVGVYGGAGFARVSGKPGDQRLTLHLQDASLAIQDATEGFNDLLTPARLTGTFTAVLNDRRAKELHYGASQVVTTALGRSLFVRGGGPIDVGAVIASR